MKRAWHTELVRGNYLALEMELNKLQGRGFEIFQILPAGGGNVIVAYQDEASHSSPPTRP